MFAANPTANVPGRIMFIIVIHGIKIGGVPWGNRLANIWSVLLIHPKI